MKKKIIKDKEFYKNISYKDLYKEYKKIEYSNTKNLKLFFNRISISQFINISIFYCGGYIPWQGNFDMKKYPEIYENFLTCQNLVKQAEEVKKGKNKFFSAEQYVLYQKYDLDKGDIGYHEYVYENMLKKAKRDINKSISLSKKCEKFSKFKVFV